MDVEKEQLKLQIIELKMAVLQYQHRDTTAQIQSLNNSSPVGSSTATAPDYFAEPKSPHELTGH